MKKIFCMMKMCLIIAAVMCVYRANPEYNRGRVSNENVNKTLDLTAMADKFNEIQFNDIYYPLDMFTGDLTGYGANCALCSGYLGCTGQNVKDGTTTYDDSTYGIVNIVASSRNLPCGSIVSFDMKGENVKAIVLDRGVLGNDLDLLVESEDYARKYVGRRKITYDVLRFGWKREAN